MKLNRITLLAVTLILTPVTATSAILKSEYGYLSAETGSTYPTLPGEPGYHESLSTDILNSEFGSGSHNSPMNPNYGWVSWNLSEDYMTFHSGQDVCMYCGSGYDYVGYGFSSLDLEWVFSVEGQGAILYQDLIGGTGEIQATLFDVTDSMSVVNLSVSSNGVTTDSFDLLDSHVYMLQANLASQGEHDGFEAQYILSLGNAMVQVPEPAAYLIFLSGLSALGFYGRRRRDGTVIRHKRSCC
jgi:hypothetical protein